jgi:hypothetical protein
MIEEMAIWAFFIFAICCLIGMVIFMAILFYENAHQEKKGNESE